MTICPTFFDVRKESLQLPYEVNTGFIYGCLIEKSQYEEKKGVYSKLLEDLDEFLLHYGFLFDDNPKVIKIDDSENECLQAISNHEYFRHHNCTTFGGDGNLLLYNFTSDVYINVLYDQRLTDPKLEWIFALHLNLTDIREVPDFLDYQLQNIFKNDKLKFIRYLECLVIEFEDAKWFSEKHHRVIQFFLNREIIALSNGATASSLNVRNTLILENNDSTTSDEKPLTPPEGWNKINCKIDFKQLKKIFSFLHTESNGDTDGLTFLTKAEVDKMLMYGLAYPPTKLLIPFKLNISRKRTLKTIYYCFYRLYQFLNPEIVPKKVIVDFLINNFQNFENSNPESLYLNIRNLKPPKMIFDLDF